MKNEKIDVEYDNVKKLFEHIPTAGEITDERYWTIASLYSAARIAYEEMECDKQVKFKKEYPLLWKNGEEVYDKLS